MLVNDYLRTVILMDWNSLPEGLPDLDRLPNTLIRKPCLWNDRIYSSQWIDCCPSCYKTTFTTMLDVLIKGNVPYHQLHAYFEIPTIAWVNLHWNKNVITVHKST
jgi:hypothetical protein